VQCGASMMCLVRWCSRQYHAKAQLQKFRGWNFLCILGTRKRNVSKINLKIINFLIRLLHVGAKHTHCVFWWNEIFLIYSHNNADYFIISSSLVHEIKCLLSNARKRFTGPSQKISVLRARNLRKINVTVYLWDMIKRTVIT